VHFYWNVGIPYWLSVILTVFMYPFQYGMPIFSSAFAEKLGYRKQMIIGFSVLTVAYVFLSFANNIPLAILGVMLIGFGIGTYKPLVSSTIAKSTPQADRNVAYSVYYWTVNLAATFFALTWGILMVFSILTQEMYAWVFRISSIFFIINLLVVIFIFREVPRTGEVKTVKDVLNNIRTAFADKKFFIMMLLMAGFWALYSTSLAPFTTIMYGFHFLPEWFPVILLGVFNPATIIILGIPLAKFVERLESLKVLMLGVIIYLLGLLVVAFFLFNPLVVFIGIIIYSIGEFMVAPGYLAFVSKLAPRSKVSAYIGCNFLASFMGIWGGALIFGLLSSSVAVGLERPHFFFGLVLAFGLLILTGFMVYYKAWGKDIIHRAAMIKAEEEGIDIEEAREKHHEPFYLKFFDKRKSIIVPLLLVPVLLISTFSIGSNQFYPAGETSKTEYEIIWEANSISYRASDFVNEGQQFEFTFEAPMMSTWINGSLSWTDEEVRVPLQNEPDSFKISLLDPEGQEVTSDGPSESGLSFSHQIDYERDEDGEIIEVNNTGTWTVLIECNNAGDVMGFFGFLTREQDPGNDVDIDVRVEYIEKRTVERS
ncbi:MAG: MFS transporter, partial [Candidatus Thermoplasmatota archaeon]|nr:MFS transporter [Candidatus Thermoplasmatota archaeon]